MTRPFPTTGPKPEAPSPPPPPNTTLEMIRWREISDRLRLIEKRLDDLELASKVWIPQEDER